MIDVSMDVSTFILFDVVCYSDCGEENNVVFSTMHTVVHDVSCSHSFAEIDRTSLQMAFSTYMQKPTAFGNRGPAPLSRSMSIYILIRGNRLNMVK